MQEFISVKINTADMFMGEINSECEMIISNTV